VHARRWGDVVCPITNPAARNRADIGRGSARLPARQKQPNEDVSAVYAATMTSATEQFSNLADVPEPSAETTDQARAVSWYRDEKLWLAMFVTLAVKGAVTALFLTQWRDASWLGHVKADLWSWREFFRDSQANRIPYVDMHREYPVLASWLYWLLAHLMNLKSDFSIQLVHAGCMALGDVVNAGLFYMLARDVNPRLALPCTLLVSLSLTGLVLGPYRFDGFMVMSLLIGYRLHKQDRPLLAAAVWSVGCAIKWFPAFLLAIQEVEAFFVRKQRWRWLKTGAVFALVQIAINGPLLVGARLKNGNIDNWTYTYTYHADRPLSADTVLGLMQLITGKAPLEHYAAHWSLVLILAAIVLKPTNPLPFKVVLVSVAALILNRIYSPQFNLWFYPFLMLVVMQVERKRALWLLVAYLVLDFVNMQVYPFAFTKALDEMKDFLPRRAFRKGGEWTALWSLCIVLRFGILSALAVEMWRGAEPATVSSARFERAFTRWRSWLSTENLLAGLTGLILIAQAFWVRAATIGMGRYSDEGYHLDQINLFCHRHYEMAQGLTMLPGYHAISAVFGKFVHNCGPHSVRSFNIGWGLAATMLAFFILKSLRSQWPLTRSVGFHFLPFLYPYYFVVYTDVLAMTTSLLAVYFIVKRYWSAASLAAIIGVTVRQPNAVVLLLIATVAWLETDTRDNLADHIVDYVKATWLCWLGIFGFCAFVVINKGVAMGDQSAHEPGLHFQNIYFSLFLLSVAVLPVTVETIWKNRERLQSPAFLAALAAVYVLYMQSFEVTHVYNMQMNFLRNALLHWVVQNNLSKSLFFLPIAAGFSCVWSMPFQRRAFWVLLPLACALLVPESLIEQRYSILPVGLWMLLRRDASPMAEWLTAFSNVVIATTLMMLVATGSSL
jgi:alpha-1,2-glucosyltransferase